MDEATIRRTKEEVEDQLLSRPGVTGVDIGRKIVNGEKTEQLAIRVYVRKKGDCRPEDIIPETIRGVPTDVIERTFLLHESRKESSQ